MCQVLKKKFCGKKSTICIHVDFIYDTGKTFVAFKKHSSKSLLHVNECTTKFVTSFFVLYNFYVNDPYSEVTTLILWLPLCF